MATCGAIFIAAVLATTAFADLSSESDSASVTPIVVALPACSTISDPCSTIEGSTITEYATRDQSTDLSLFTTTTGTVYESTTVTETSTEFSTIEATETTTTTLSFTSTSTYTSTIGTTSTCYPYGAPGSPTPADGKRAKRTASAEKVCSDVVFVFPVSGTSTGPASAISTLNTESSMVGVSETSSMITKSSTSHVSIPSGPGPEIVSTTYSVREVVTTDASGARITEAVINPGAHTLPFGSTTSFDHHMFKVGRQGITIDQRVYTWDGDCSTTSGEPLSSAVIVLSPTHVSTTSGGFSGSSQLSSTASTGSRPTSESTAEQTTVMTESSTSPSATEGSTSSTDTADSTGTTTGVDTSIILPTETSPTSTPTEITSDCFCSGDSTTTITVDPDPATVTSTSTIETDTTETSTLTSTSTSTLTTVETSTLTYTESSTLIATTTTTISTATATFITSFTGNYTLPLPSINDIYALYNFTDFGGYDEVHGDCDGSGTGVDTGAAVYACNGWLECISICSYANRDGSTGPDGETNWCVGVTWALAQDPPQCWLKYAVPSKGIPEDEDAGGCGNYADGDEEVDAAILVSSG